MSIVLPTSVLSDPSDRALPQLAASDSDSTSSSALAASTRRARPTSGPSARPSRRALAAPPAADRLLIIRLGAMGDVLRTIPAARRIRAMYPGAHLAWLVEPASAGVVDAARIVDETLVFPRADLEEALRAGDALSLLRQLFAFLRQVRRRRFEVVIDFHGLLKSGLLSLSTGAPIRFGFGRPAARELSYLFANHRLALRDCGLSRYARNDALVDALASRGPSSDPAPVGDAAAEPAGRDGDSLAAPPMLQATALARARLAARLRVTGREQETGFVLIHPGTSRGARHKRYAPSAWAAVARILVERGIDVWVAAGASRDERSLVDRIVRESGGAAHTAPETRSFDDLLALLDRVSVFASADTGPLHAASLSGVPVVQLLGPTEPIQNEPWAHTPSRRVYVPLSCAPCRRGCATASCMAVLPPDLVAEAIQSLHGRIERAAPREESHS